MARQPESWARGVLGLLPLCMFLLAGGLLGDSGVRSSLAGEGLGFTDDPRRLIVYGSAYVMALLWLIGHSSAALQLAKRLWPWWLLVGYALLSMAWSSFPLKVFINCGHYAGETLVAIAAVLAVKGNDRRLCVVMAWMLGIITVLSFVAVRLGLPGSIDPDSGRWAGTVANSNNLGLVCAVLIGLAVQLFLRCASLLGRIACVAGLVAGVVVLLGSGSATALLVATLLGTSIGWMLIGGSNARSGFAIRIVTGMGLGLLLLGAAVAFAPDLLQLKTGLQVLGRSETLTGRTEVWAFGWATFIGRPLLGYSFDSLASVLSNFGFAVGHLHNGYLDLLVRGGVVAGAIYVVMYVRNVVQLFVRASHQPDAVFWLMLVIAQTAYEIAESSIARPVHFLWFTVLVSMLIVQPQARSESNRAEEVANAGRYRHPARPAALPNLLR